MQFIQTYTITHPEDTLVLIGGAAASLWVKSILNKDLPFKDIDIHINTKESTQTILDRWIKLLPNTYEVCFVEDEIFTFVDIAGIGISYDIFINQIKYPELTSVDGIYVEPLQNTIIALSNELMMCEYDNLLISPEEVLLMKDKLERLTERLQLLKECS